jgi:hypothetical protein
VQGREVSVVLFYEQHGETTKRKGGEDTRAQHAVTASTSASSRLAERLCRA